MSLVIAVSGAHGSGKTTLCQQLAAELKKQSYSVGLVSGSSRSSHYLITGDKSSEMHVEVFALQLLNELRALQHYPIVVSDRSIYDFLAYARLRFAPDDFAVRALSAFAREYRHRYDLILKTTAYYGVDDNDSFRRHETTSADAVSTELTSIFGELSIPFQELPQHDALSMALRTSGEFIKQVLSVNKTSLGTAD